MAYDYNDVVVQNGTTPFLESYANYAAIAAISPVNLMDGVLVVALDTRAIYMYKASNSTWTKYTPTFGTVTWQGGQPTFNASIAGVTSTDIVVASVKNKGTTAFLSVGATAGAGQVTFEVTGPVPSNDLVVSYVIQSIPA